MSLKTKTPELTTAKDAASILNCSRGHIERLQLKGKLTAVSTVYPKYFFKKSQVLKLKESLTSIKAAQ